MRIVLHLEEWSRLAGYAARVACQIACCALHVLPPERTERCKDGAVTVVFVWPHAMHIDEA